ncbi:MAG: M60 family metallopeptidase, partial [Phycisphaeraceae bacterium]
MKINMQRLGLCIGLLMSVTMLSSVATATEGAAAIRDNVNRLIAPGTPGALAVYGEDAAVIATGRSGDVEVPVVAAGGVGSGRVVAFAHTDYINARAFDHDDTARLLNQAVLWASGKDDAATVRVAAYRNKPLADRLRKAAFDAVATPSLTDAAREADVIILHGSTIENADQRRTLAKHLQRGGGMLIADTPWGWLQINRGTLDDHQGNQILRHAGIAYTEATTAPHHDGELDLSRRTDLAHSRRAVEALIANHRENVSMSSDDLAQASASAIAAVNAVQASNEFVAWMQQALGDLGDLAYPSETNPLTGDNGIARLSLSLEHHLAQNLPLDKIKPHIGAEVYPGLPTANAGTISKTIAVDTSIPDWHSTGLYASPGATIGLRIPRQAVDAGLRVRIGAHRYALWHLPEWKRHPEIDRTAPLDQLSVQVANPFGGLIYIEVPGNADPTEVRVRIDGAVRAPYYVHDQTSVSDWRTAIRNAPAPWAELANDQVILTVPSSVVRDLDNPHELMDYWAAVMDACGELAQISGRRRPERLVPDAQLRVGYMHAGYPIMTHMDVQRAFVDLQTLKNDGNWGFYHEIGHNHQSPEWTFDGTVEVTVNLFTLYVYEKVNG